MRAESTTKLLIVDDLPENLLTLSKIIEQDDRIIYQAKSGEDALELLLEHDFALAILDVMMPGMDGFELAELMRGTEKTRNIPIVFVSAAGRELNYAFKGYEHGAVDFLYKPLDVATLRSKVNVFVTLYQHRIELRRQVEELEKSRKELHATQLDLQLSLKMRDDFTALVAHELRTPLSTLSVETQLRNLLLEKGDMSVFDENRLRQMVSRDERQIKSMIRLVDDMVDVTRIRSGKLSIRPAEMELAVMLQRIVSDISAQARAAGSSITLQAHDKVPGIWDEFRVEQIVINLLTNALRYGEGKPISVTLVSGPDIAEISVKDQGIGIAPADQLRIFNPFERVESKGFRDGLGLGLFIARQLAEAHGGSLSVNSRCGEGSEFRLFLPKNI